MESCMACGLFHEHDKCPEQHEGSKSAVHSLVGRISAEVERSTTKFPTWPTDPLHALAVLGEEFGELTKAMLQLTYEPHKTSAAEVRTEAIQTAAMALRLAMSLDRYWYAPCEQHSQSEGMTAEQFRYVFQPLSKEASERLEAYLP